MTQLLSFPFRLNPAGYAVTLPDGSDEYYAEELGLLVLTSPGERQQVPTYGMDDPVFSTVNAAVLASQVGTFGPPVKIASVNTTQVTESRQQITVSFDTSGSPDSSYGVADLYTPTSQQATFVNTGDVNG